MALVSTAGTDSIITDSANAMSAFTTGHKSCVNAMGVYCARNKGTLDHPKVETIAELAKRKLGIAIGVVTNTEIEDATPWPFRHRALHRHRARPSIGRGHAPSCGRGP